MKLPIRGLLAVTTFGPAPGQSRAACFRNLIILADRSKTRGGAEMTTRSIRRLFGAPLITALIGTTPSAADAASTLTTLYEFTGANSGDGAAPTAGLISDRTGVLYGTTQTGGNQSIDVKQDAEALTGDNMTIEFGVLVITCHFVASI